MWDWLWWIASNTLFYGGSLLGLGIFSLYLFQNKLLYLPNAPSPALHSPDNNPEGYRHPGQRHLKYQDVTIRTSDGVKIKGWLVLHENSRNRDTIIFFHENAGNIGTRLPFVEQLYHYCASNVLMVAYRGYSNSEGKPTEAGLQLDAEAVFNFALNCSVIDPTRLYIFGRSLGGAVSIQLAEKVQGMVQGLILENTFTNIAQMVDHIFPYLKWIKWLVLRNFWPSHQRIGKIQLPIMFISGTADALVPPKMVRVLRESATSSAFTTFHEVEGGQHNDSWYIGGQEYVFSIRNFMDHAKKFEIPPGNLPERARNYKDK